MSPAEAASLLTIAAAFDNRKPDADQARAWSMALDGIRFEDARDAVVAHYRVSKEWLMPSEVIATVKRIRAKRIDDFGPFDPPPGVHDPLEYREYLANTRRQIADGALTRERYDAQQAALGITRREVPALDDVFRRVPDVRAELAAARKASQVAPEPAAEETSA
jgi:hypothetical protein